MGRCDPTKGIGMTYLQQYKATLNPDFYGRVYASAHKAAVDVNNEAFSTPGHQGRAVVAQRVLQNDKAVLTAFVWECAMNPTIAANMDADGATSSPDGDLDYQVASSWDTVVAINPPWAVTA